MFSSKRKDGKTYIELKNVSEVDTKTEVEKEKINRFAKIKRDKEEIYSKDLPVNRKLELEIKNTIERVLNSGHVERKDIRNFMKYFNQEMLPGEVNEICNEVFANDDRVSLENASILNDSDTKKHPTEELTNDLRIVFDVLDSDGDEIINSEDLRKRLTAFSEFVPVTEADAQQWMTVCEKGRLNFEELLKLVV